MAMEAWSKALTQCAVTPQILRPCSSPLHPPCHTRLLLRLSYNIITSGSTSTQKSSSLQLVKLAMLRGRVFSLLSSLRNFQPYEGLVASVQPCRCVHSLQRDATEAAVQHSQSRSLAQPAFVEEEGESSGASFDLRPTEITSETR